MNTLLPHSQSYKENPQYAHKPVRTGSGNELQTSELYFNIGIKYYEKKGVTMCECRVYQIMNYYLLRFIGSSVVLIRPSRQCFHSYDLPS